MKVATVQTWLAFAVECGYLEAEVGQGHRLDYEIILKEIGLLAEEAIDWSMRAIA